MFYKMKTFIGMAKMRVGNLSYYYCINFYNGNVSSYDKNSSYNSYHVRAVRSLP